MNPNGPPWTYSPLFKGEFIYNPESDKIVLKDGRTFARAAGVSKASLSNAIWTGPVNQPGSPPQNAGYIHQAGQQYASQAGMTPANTPRQMGGPSRGSRAPMRGGRGGLARGTSGTQARQNYQEIGPWGETPVVFQTTTQSQFNRGEIRPPGARERGINIGVDSITSTLFPTFKLRDHDFFVVGRVFQVLWSEPAGGTSLVTNWNAGIVLNQFKERVFSKVRRFVVIRAGDNYCSALPINSYGGQGVAKRGVKKSEHVIVFSGGSEPPRPSKNERPGRGEASMQSVPIRIDPDSQGDHLDEMSRLNLAGVTTVHHNIKVKSVGNVNSRSLRPLMDQFAVVWGPQQLPAPRMRTTGEADEGAADDSDDEINDNDQVEDDEDDDDEDDEDEEEDASDGGEDAPVVGQRVIRQQPLVLR